MHPIKAFVQNDNALRTPGTTPAMATCVKKALDRIDVRGKHAQQNDEEAR